jgi:DNA-binding NarL/FixJ family response regulator
MPVISAETGALYGRAARLELAAALRAAGRDEHAVQAEEQGRYRARGARPPPTGTISGTGTEGLTRREQDVLRLVAEGRETARSRPPLFLSVRTVEHHVASIYASSAYPGGRPEQPAPPAPSHGLA